MNEYDIRRIAEMIEAVLQTNMNYISVVSDASEGEVLVKIQFND